jgi:hypothetical protein
MIIRAEFVVTVRCDSPRIHPEPFLRETSFTGQTRAHAIREARKAGWLVGSSRVVANRAYCPDCHEHAPKHWRRGFRKL